MIIKQMTTNDLKHAIMCQSGKTGIISHLLREYYIDQLKIIDQNNKK